MAEINKPTTRLETSTFTRFLDLEPMSVPKSSHHENMQYVYLSFLLEEIIFNKSHIHRASSLHEQRKNAKVLRFSWFRKKMSQISHSKSFFPPWTEQKVQKFWDWHDSEKNYHKSESFIMSLLVVNDKAERGIKLISDYYWLIDQKCHRKATGTNLDVGN